MKSEASKNSEQHIKLPIEVEADESFAADLRGFGPFGILAMLIIFLTGNITVGNVVLPVGAVLVLLWVRLSRTLWPEIGFVRPKNWIITVVLGLVFGIALKFLMKAIVMPLLGADPINQPYHYFAGNQALLPVAIWAMIAAGFGEEIVFRGYMFERFGKLFGSGVWAKIFIVLITSLWFGLGHYFNLGFSGVEQATATGLVFGITFALTGRIWLVIFAHTAYDLTALAMIYWNLESDVAHLIFK